MFLRQRSDSLPIVTGRGLWTLTETTRRGETDLRVKHDMDRWNRFFDESMLPVVGPVTVKCVRCGNKFETVNNYEAECDLCREER